MTNFKALMANGKTGDGRGMTLDYVSNVPARPPPKDFQDSKVFVFGVLAAAILFVLGLKMFLDRQRRENPEHLQRNLSRMLPFFIRWGIVLGAVMILLKMVKIIFEWQ